MLNIFIRFLSIYVLSFSFLLSFDGDTHDFYLSNGLKVIIQESHSFPRLAVNIAFDIGSHDDPLGKKGLTHIMGELMWQGSENYKKDEHYSLIEETGGWSNVDLWHIDDHLQFRNLTTTDNYELVLKLEADRMESLLINSETVSTAKDLAIDHLHEQMSSPWSSNITAISSLWTDNHPYSFYNGGTIEDIQNISVEDCQSAYDKYFNPNNAVLVIVGDVDPINSLELINKYFGSIKPSESLPENPNLSRQIKVNTKEKLRIMDTKLPHKLYFHAYSIPTMRDKDDIILELLDVILDIKSYQFEIDNNFVTGSNTWKNEKLGDGFFIFIVATNPYVPIKKSRQAVSQFINKLKREGIEEEQINIGKKTLLRRRMYEKYWTGKIADKLSYSEILHGDYKMYTNQLEIIKEINNEDLKRVANKYFINEKEIEMQPENNNIFKQFVYSLYYTFF